jgi:hypothetical protein
VAAKRITATVWILRPRGALGEDVVPELLAAFFHALDQGARDVVVDLSAAQAIDRAGATTIGDLAEKMLERGSALWLAASWPSGDGHTLRPIRRAGTDALRGVRDDLDQALDARLARESHTNT